MYLNNDVSGDLERMTEFVSVLMPLFPQEDEHIVVYDNVGALVADVVLQSGLNYKHVVLPRVERILAKYGSYSTTEEVSALLRKITINNYLAWRHNEKIERFYRVLYFLFDKNINTVEDLAVWINKEQSNGELLELKGIGPKSVDYMKLLCGVDSCAIDRHLSRAIRMAGINTSSYEYMSWLFSQTAKSLGVSARILDKGLWRVVKSYN